MSDAGTSESGTAAGQDGSGEPRSPEEIEAELEQTRRDLGETVDALSAKLDVRTRAKDQVAASRRRAGEQVQVVRERVSRAAAKGRDAATDEEGSVRPVIPAGAGGVALLILGAVVVVVVRRRRRGRLVLLERRR